MPRLNGGAINDRLRRSPTALKGKHMLRGFTTINYWADDIPAARKWYSELLGIEPYFQQPNAEQPAYVEFGIGDYQHELGLIDRRYAPKAWTPGAGGVVMYWHVDDIQATFAKLLEMGATEFEPPISRGGAGFVTASVVDPFGNILGLMYNPHYLAMLDETKKA